jgi:hypothetical protein
MVITSFHISLPCSSSSHLCHISASIATIIRIPYINGLKPGSDFLYNATDVSIWSMIETGLALSACAAATIRPLYRKLTNQSLNGHATPQGATAYPQNTLGSVRAGYMRSGSGNDHNHGEDINIQRDPGKTTGIRTEIRPYVGSDDLIYLTSWPEEGQSDVVEVDKASSSSQKKLKDDEESNLQAADISTEIWKAMAVSSKVSKHGV